MMKKMCFSIYFTIISSNESFSRQAFCQKLSMFIDVHQKIALIALLVNSVKFHAHIVHMFNNSVRSSK